MAPRGGIFGTQEHCQDNLELLQNSSRTATGKDNRFGKQTDQYHLPHGYCYLPSQQPFPGTLQFYQHFPFSMTHSLQPTTSASEGYQSYGPHWQGYHLHHGGWGGSQMFPPAAKSRTMGVISRCTMSASWPTWKHSSQSTNIFQPWMLWGNLIPSVGESDATGRVAYLPCHGGYTMFRILATRRVVYYAHRPRVRHPVLCVWNVVTYMHNQNDTCVTLFAGAPLTLYLLTQSLTLYMPFTGRVPYFTSPLLLFIRCHTLPYMFYFEILSLITIQPSLQIHGLLLHLLRNYRILQVWNILSNLHTL